MVKKIFLPWLWTACLLMLSANPAMSRSGFVADAPNGAPAAANLRPAYFLQLKGLQERLVQDVPAAVLQHTVMPGESLTAIAATYGVSVATLAVANNLENPNLIYPGQVLSIPVASTAGNDAPALVHEVKRGDTVWGLAKLYQVGMEAILAANSISDPDKLEPGQKLVIPGGKPPAAGTRVIASRTSSRQEPVSTPAFAWPVSGRITSGFGPRWGGFHYGLDLAAPAGSPVRAIFSGVVTVAGWVGSYGYMVCIDHQNGWESVYGHNARLHVTVGQTVQKGQTIAAVGRTGNATGPHVHLETIYLGRHQDPLKFLPARRE